jgi:DNA-binding response OmpR family regulator
MLINIHCSFVFFFLYWQSQINSNTKEGVNAMQLTQPPKRLGEMDARAERPVVLVIDDHPAILDMLDTTLALRGYQPVCIANGQEALEWIKNTLHIGQYPMVILLDLHMPVMNGTGFLASLHAQWDAPVPIPPIILLTVDKGDYSHLGCNDVLIKPFRIRDLYERLRLVVSPDSFDAGE